MANHVVTVCGELQFTTAQVVRRVVVLCRRGGDAEPEHAAAERGFSRGRERVLLHEQFPRGGSARGADLPRGGLTACRALPSTLELHACRQPVLPLLLVYPGAVGLTPALYTRGGHCSLELRRQERERSKSHKSYRSEDLEVCSLRLVGKPEFPLF